MTSELISQLLLGGLLGTVGQMLRIFVGMKKLYDDALKNNKSFKDLFVPSATIISLLIGFVAGVLAIISISNFKSDFFSGTNVKQNFLALIASGYAGTDFIEGFVRKYLPNSQAQDTLQQPDAYKNIQFVNPTNAPAKTPQVGGTPHP